MGGWVAPQRRRNTIAARRRVEGSRKRSARNRFEAKLVALHAEAKDRELDSADRDRANRFTLHGSDLSGLDE
jgi:hypothetical protein